MIFLLTHLFKTVQLFLQNNFLESGIIGSKSIHKTLDPCFQSVLQKLEH